MHLFSRARPLIRLSYVLSAHGHLQEKLQAAAVFSPDRETTGYQGRGQLRNNREKGDVLARDQDEIFQGTIEAMQRLPEAAIQQQKEANDSSTAKPEDLMSLFKLPADIMTKLAVNAGYMDEPQTSTYRPWIVARYASFKAWNTTQNSLWNSCATVKLDS